MTQKIHEIRSDLQTLARDVRKIQRLIDEAGDQHEQMFEHRLNGTSLSRFTTELRETVNEVQQDLGIYPGA